ncbi:MULTISPECIES: hypothetical protein [unclassified Streptomyces]|uniref:hypothetical protein n=1 Tax=unclassified Streptomyces TaxID=2593676 RepID=UPI000C27E2AF|nr:hypothetical protein [Streptomyces sp. CB02959]PJN38879.1 hypothetical protein CG747_20170 [Streptomyces sp. CB02959]
MLTLLSGLLAGARRTQRVILFALALLPVLIVTLASVPALLVLPFLRARGTHTHSLVRELAAWMRSLMVSSRGR